MRSARNDGSLLIFPDSNKRWRFSKQNINIPRLEEDLKSLTKTSDLPNLPTLVLGSKDDLIIPPKLLEDNFLAKKRAKIVLHDRGGHGLGLVNAEFVYKEIRTFLDGYKSY